MTPRRLRGLMLLGVAAAAWCAAAPAAGAAPPPAPVWNLAIHHDETRFPPGGTAEYWFDVRNVGEAGSSGQVTLTVHLPAGLSRDSVFESNGAQVAWSCPGSPGDATVTCTTTDAIAHHQLDSGLVVAVDVAANASTPLTTTATLEGGGAAAAATDSESTEVSREPAGFGIVPGSFLAEFFEADGLTPVRRAGAHPYAATFAFDMNTVANPQPAVPDHKSPAGNLRDLQVELPPGFVGNPSAVGECTPAQLTVGACPRSSQVGRVDVALSPVGEVLKEVSKTTGVYNMTHPRGVVADLAFEVAGNPVHIRASLDPSRGYAVKASVSNVNETLNVYDQQLTLWGVPADPSHDWERCPGFSGAVETRCPTEAAEKAFLTTPSRCEAGDSTTLTAYDSWQSPGAFGPDVIYQMPGQASGCEEPRFEPEVRVHPTSSQASTPTGLEMHVRIPQSESPDGLATPPVKRVRVTLPEGMTVSPSFADGLASCSPAQIGLGTDMPVACPDASRIGAVTLSTPLLPRPLQGSMYLAAQGDNPFGSPFAMYVVLHDEEERGILVKLPGRIDLDSSSGRITASFEGLPQLPFEALTLAFRSGPRAPLVNPPACGTQTIGVEIASYAQPDSPVQAGSDYAVTEGPDGSGCPPSLAARPFSPRLDAGTVNPRAGAFSPFVFRLTREDREQELSQVATTLPPGLVARIAGTSECSDAALAAVSSAEGTARRELEAPSCPASSQVGTLDAGIGSGASPDYFPGRIYLAGPYEGAPLSLAIVVPGLAGPYDLGSVLVRAALYVDPETAQVRVVSDPLPPILHGVPLEVRDIRLKADRAETTLNPTSCAPMSVAARVTAAAAAADLSNRFQVGDCASLGFRPRLGLRLHGPTGRGAHPGLRAVLTMPRHGANVASAAVTLPRSEFLDQSHIRTICTRVQFAQEACPAGSVYGYARAVTPLLARPLEGPVYLRSSSHRLPDLVAALRGQIGQIDLDGRIDSVHGAIRTTFETVPDAPVTRFVLTMQGGGKGLLVNSVDLCAAADRAAAVFAAHNGRVARLAPSLANGCRGQSRGRQPHTRPSRRISGPTRAIAERAG